MVWLGRLWSGVVRLVAVRLGRPGEMRFGKLRSGALWPGVAGRARPGVFGIGKAGPG